MTNGPKPVKRLRRTIVAVFGDENVPPVSTRLLAWEEASRSGSRAVHRVEYAAASVDSDGEAYLIDVELEGRGVSRHDLTKLVRTYLPEVYAYYITE